MIRFSTRKHLSLIYVYFLFENRKFCIQYANVQLRCSPTKNRVWKFDADTCSAYEVWQYVKNFMTWHGHWTVCYKFNQKPPGLKIRGLNHQTKIIIPDSLDFQQRKFESDDFVILFLKENYFVCYLTLLTTLGGSKFCVNWE